MGNSHHRYNCVVVDITSAEPIKVLGEASACGIDLFDISNIDSLTLRVACSASDLNMVKEIVDKNGGKYKIYKGKPDYLSLIRMRLLIAIAGVALLVLVCFLPTRILFVRVEGNVSVPTSSIISAAQLCGVRFGASRREIRSEKVKNTLLRELPQLQWLGINTKGCIATINVREKTKIEALSGDVGTGSITASTDGIIQNCVVLNGTAVCKVGDAVLAGEVLVSGYTDCGIILKSVRAEAEISAYTMRTICAIAPKPKGIRKGQIGEKTLYSVRVGKKLINFFKCSGILDAGCVKMYSEEFLTLPGGFTLPISLITQRYLYYDLADILQPKECDWLSGCVRWYLQSTYPGCQIISENTKMNVQEGYCVFNGKYICLENIGRFVNEEIISDDGKTN